MSVRFFVTAAAVAAVMMLLGCAIGAEGAPAKGKEANLEWLQAKQQEPGVHKLKSGLLFKILKKGDGKKSPRPSDSCAVHYAGTLIDGSKFDSSYDRGAPATFKPTQVIKGWTEALQLMKEGDKWEVYIPYDLAYGPSGRPPKIPAFATLIFTMELIRIEGGGGRSAEESIKKLEIELNKPYDEL